MECGLCAKEMKNYEHNNPAPLKVERVCRDCNFIVTATRINLRFWNLTDEGTREVILDWMARTLQMANSLKNASNDAMIKMSKYEDFKPEMEEEE